MASDLTAPSELVVPFRRRTAPLEVTFNLNWASPDDPTDLDIGCLYRLVDGTINAKQSIEPSEKRRSHGPTPRVANDIELSSWSIALDGDDRDGSTPRGETLTFRDPQTIGFAVVFASIYRGVSDFRRVDATLEIAIMGRPPTVMRLANPDPGLRWCAILACGTDNGEFVVIKQERYFLSALHADRHYGFGLDWTVGYKPLEA